MTQKNRATLNSEADASINDNTIGDVAPADVRQRVKDLADSSVNLSDDVVPSSENPLDHDVDDEVPSMATMMDYVDDALSGSGGYVLLAELATTSGTTKDFTIPAGAKSIVVMLNGVSCGGAATALGIQLGDSGGIEATGYSGMACTTEFSGSSTLVSSSSQFAIGSVNIATALSGSVTLSRMNGTHRWVASGGVAGPGTTGGGTNVGAVCSSGGAKTLSAELTTVRLIGASAFDAGSVSVMWQ